MKYWKKYLLLIFFMSNLIGLYPQQSVYSDHFLFQEMGANNLDFATENLYSLYLLNSYEDAVSLAQQYVDSALLTNDSTQLANMLLTLGIMQENKGENNEAFETFLTAYTIFKSIQNQTGIAVSMDHLGTIFRYHGSQQKSLEYHTKAYELLKQENHKHGLINVLNNLGIINRQLGNDTEALTYHKKALSIAIKEKSISISSIYISLGTYYWYKGVIDSALFYYKSALSIPPDNLPLKERHCAALNNIGNVYRTTLKYDSALYYYNLAFQESKRYQTRNLESVNLKNLGRIYTLLGQYNTAYDFFQRSLQIATEINLKKVILEDYHWLGELFEIQQDYKKALDYFKKYSSIEHLILDEKQLAEINQLERDFTIEQADKRQALQLKEKSEKNLLIQKKRTSETIYIALLFLMVSSSLFIYFQYRTKKKSNLLLIKLNEELEIKVKERTKSLYEAKDRAEESDRLKSAFLANMSHEIRTPMNGILGFTSLLQQPNLTVEKQQKYLDIIKKSGGRMLSTVNDIIDISRIEANLVELVLSEVDIEVQLKELHSFFIPEAAKKGIQLILKNDISDQNNKLITDPEKFNSILTNLIKNAIKFTEKGFIEFGYCLKKDTHANDLVFYVKDSGIGIPKDRLHAIFDRFVQADIEDKMAVQGSGLGLAISKAYAEMLGGELWVESEEGIGSTFYFTLENKAETKPKSAASNKGKIVERKGIEAGLNILIVEDDEASQQLISILIEKFTRKIAIVSTGIEAVETCMNNPDIDLILMDIQLPDMNGYEATRKIRQFNKEVVILAQTAFALTGDREKAINVGCNDYISKPINESELDLLIESYAKKYQVSKKK